MTDEACAMALKTYLGERLPGFVIPDGYRGTDPVKCRAGAEHALAWEWWCRFANDNYGGVSCEFVACIESMPDGYEDPEAFDAWKEDLFARFSGDGEPQLADLPETDVAFCRSYWGACPFGLDPATCGEHDEDGDGNSCCSRLL